MNIIALIDLALNLLIQLLTFADESGQVDPSDEKWIELVLKTSEARKRAVDLISNGERKPPVVTP